MKKTKNPALKWILKATRPHLVSVILLALVYALNAFVGVYYTFFAKNIVDAAVARQLDGVIKNGVIFLLMVVFQILSIIFSKHLNFEVAARLEIKMKSQLFAHMLEKEFSDISAYHSGELLNRLSSDVAVVAGAITTIIPNVVFFVVKLVGVIYILITIDVWLALIFSGLGVLVFFVATLFKPITMRLHKNVQQTDGVVRSFMQEALASLLMIKTFNAQDQINENAALRQDENYRAKKRRNRFSILTSTGMNTAFSMAYVFGFIWAAVNIFLGNITYGTLTQIITLVGQVRTPVQGLSGVLPTYFNALASAERMMEIEDIPDEEAINTEIDPDELYDALCSIEFNDISFAYDQNRVFDHTSLSVKKGDFLDISGISGIGKSTLLKLLLSVYAPDSGEIVLSLNDKTVPVDRMIRRLFSYVPQGNFLLSGTLRENIAFVRPDASDDEILSAAKLACADGFISELDDGLDTVIGERGGGLSEGQVQRIAIARAILSRAPVILLDEATSALDEATEEQLLSNLRSLNDKTCIIVSHKKAAQKICNRTVFIVDKKIVEADPSKC